MSPNMIKRRRISPVGAIVSALVLFFTGLGLAVPTQAASPVVPAASVVSVQSSAMVATPQSVVMVPKAIRRAPILNRKYAQARVFDRWGQSCNFQMGPLNGTHWRVFEVRKDRWRLGTCQRTGFHYDVRDGHSVGVWVYH